MSENNTNIAQKLNPVFDRILEQVKSAEAEIDIREFGKVIYSGRGITRVAGLPDVEYEELVRFHGGRYGIAFNLDESEVAVVMLDESEEVYSGSEARRTGRTLDVPVGEDIIGRVIDPIGRPLDDRGAIEYSGRRQIEREAPAIMDRSPVEQPVQTGIQVIDALIPIGRGQRELILGDRQTGKTSIALDAIINQDKSDIISIYCAVGKRSAAVANVIAELEEFGAMERTIIVAATGDNTPGMNFAAPFAATSIGEYFMDMGRDVLIVYDDLTSHARAYRELSLLLRRPPAREAYPGDIFYLHSRLLERSTHLSEEIGGGSLTALPIIETQAQNISDYIPTNLISITDGQIYLSPDLFLAGALPAIDVGKSVSRVGGKTQLPAYREVAGDLRLAYSQFEELESFSRFGTRLDEETRKTLERGRRVREVFKQNEHDTFTVAEQIAVLLAVNEGLLDEVELSDMDQAKKLIRRNVLGENEKISEKIQSGKKLEDEDIEKLTKSTRKILESEGLTNGTS
ncbi:MAG: alternate F1F0 ATPase, F1 subunit alpha [Candidatus Kapaibacterium sp.]